MDIEFGEQYDADRYTLIEVPSNIVDNITKGDKLIIKGNEVTVLCTETKSYELKYLETSNCLYLLKAGNKELDVYKKAEILTMSNHIVECIEVIPKKYSVISKIKYNCRLSYDYKTGRNNISGNYKLYKINFILIKI